MERSSHSKRPTVSIIGSFKQHYSLVLDAIKAFKRNGILVLSPIGSEIIQPVIPFVRFLSDPKEKSDEIVQTITLGRIFLSKAVYVVAPNGYVGRTTCYEIGRAIQIRKPVYFSCHPIDLPIKIPESHILTPEQLSKKILSQKIVWPFSIENDEYYQLENELFQVIGNKIL